MSKIEKTVAWAEQIAADDRHGYSQVHRNSPDYDCSSFLGTALAHAGFPISIYSTTRNLGEQLENAGFVKCGKPWRRGDIHLAAGHHVTMSVDANRIVHASQAENGGIDGQTGDQTGKKSVSGLITIFRMIIPFTIGMQEPSTKSRITSWKVASRQNPHVVLTEESPERIIPMIAIICVLAQEWIKRSF